MAVTFSNVRRVVAGNHVRVVGTITGPASYTTGGETLSAAQIQILTNGGSKTSLSGCLTFDSEVEPANFRNLVLDRTNLKMLFSAGATQVVSTTNLSAVAINFESIVEVDNAGTPLTA